MTRSRRWSWRWKPGSRPPASLDARFRNRPGAPLALDRSTNRAKAVRSGETPGADDRTPVPLDHLFAVVEVPRSIAPVGTSRGSEPGVGVRLGGAGEHGVRERDRPEGPLLDEAGVGQRGPAHPAQPGGGHRAHAADEIGATVTTGRAACRVRG